MLCRMRTLNPHPFTDLLKLSNLAWAKCCGMMTLVKRYLSWIKHNMALEKGISYHQIIVDLRILDRINNNGLLKTRGQY